MHLPAPTDLVLFGVLAEDAVAEGRATKYRERGQRIKGREGPQEKWFGDFQGFSTCFQTDAPSNVLSPAQRVDWTVRSRCVCSGARLVGAVIASGQLAIQCVSIPHLLKP